MISLIKILTEVSIDQLRRDWVDSNKISKELFELLCKCTNNQSTYTTWMVKRVSEDAYMKDTFTHMVQNPDKNTYNTIVNIYQDTFNFFTKNKQFFEIKDINQYKTIRDFLDAFAEARHRKEDKDSAKDVNRFKLGTVKALNGTEYDVYKLPKGHPENKPIAIMLGRHASDANGWCTSYDGENGWWEQHISREDLYIFINPNNTLSDKFQIAYGYTNSLPFNIRDKAETGPALRNLIPFYDFLHEKEGRPYPEVVKKLKEDIFNLEGAKAPSVEKYRLGKAYEIDMYNLSNVDPKEWVLSVGKILNLNEEQIRFLPTFIKTYTFNWPLWVIPATEDNFTDAKFFTIRRINGQKFLTPAYGYVYGLNQIIGSSESLDKAVTIEPDQSLYSQLCKLIEDIEDTWEISVELGPDLTDILLGN